MEPYAATAEFYDLLHRERYRARAHQLLRVTDYQPTIGVLEIGAGSGLVTTVLAEAYPDVPILAVEPATPMRALLLGRLAAAEELRSRVTVYPAEVQALDLEGVADLAVCVDVAATLAPDQRRGVWAATARALVPGGVLLVESPPPVPESGRASLPCVRVGADRYTGEVTATATGPGTVRWRFTYRVLRDDRVLREMAEEFDGWSVDPDELRTELAGAGFVDGAAVAGDVLVLRRG